MKAEVWCAPCARIALPFIPHLSSFILVHARQHLRDMQHQGPGVAASPQPTFDVQNAAEVAQYQGVGAARLHVFALEIGDAREDIAILHRESAAESAAL